MQTKPAPHVAATPESIHPEQRLRFEIVSALTGWKRSKLYAEVRAGRFPAPERDGPRCSRWRAGDVLNALQARRRGSA